MSIYQPVNWTTVAAMATAWLAAQVLLVRSRPSALPPPDAARPNVQHA